MTEYHGWASINQSIDGENEERIENLLAEVDHMFSKSKVVNEYFKIIRINYSKAIHFAGAHNHNGTLLNRILDLFKSIGKIAPGSYGLLYFRDDESLKKPNEFSVYVMTKGQVELKDDIYLSPCNPEIEV